MKPLRIGIFTECYHPTLNGVVISIETFRQELEKRGHQYYIFAPATKGFHDINPRVFRYPSCRWPKQKYYPIALPFLAPLQTAQIRNLRLDLIHTQHLFSMGKLGLKVARTLDIPVVHTYHTLIVEYTHYFPLFSDLARKFVIRMSRNYCNACDQVVTPSPSMQQFLRSYGVVQPIEAIPTGVNLDDFSHPFSRDELKTKWNIPKNQKLLLYVSRIAKEKNLDFLFKAIRRLTQKHQDFHLLLVGGGPELGYYRNKVKSWHLDKKVTFTDMQEKKTTNRFFGAADIFVFPSTTETQGIVIAEAMAAGIPAVAVGIMGPSDIIKDGVDGYLTGLKVEEFTDRIEKLLNDERLRKKFGKQAKGNASRFSVKITADHMEIIYEQTINHYRSQ